MVMFVVTLFSPTTVAFHSPSDASPVKAGASSAKQEGSQSPPQDYYNHKQVPSPEDGQTPQPQHGRSQSLTNPPTFTQGVVQTPGAFARTPGATLAHEEYFRPHGGLSSAYRLTLPERGMVRNPSTSSLQTLAALDAQPSSWGKNQDLNQPNSLAQTPPSQSIFNDSAATLNAGQPPTKFARPSRRAKPSKQKKKEIDYTTDNYTVEISTLGNAGLFEAINAAAGEDDALEKLWVGTLGMPTDALPEDVKHHIAVKLENEHETLAVFIDDTDMNSHYENYCKNILWPMLHSQVPDVPSSKAYQDNSWSHFVKVNQAFADIVIKNYKKGDVVWVHDYHLLLVPQIVRKHHPEAQIGLYIHSAFPPSEIFRILPSRCDLILGMLGANMIAFQTEDFRYQFLQTCSRLLNIEATEHGLVLEDGRFIDVFTVPMGIDIAAMNIRRQLPEVKDHMKELSEKFHGKRLIVSRDKLDGIHGIKHKLKGYEYFLDAHPEWADQAVLVQVATSTTTDRDLRDEVNGMITKINGEWGSLNHQPIVYLNQDIDYSQYLALLCIADCLWVNSLSEGMNLTCHEFIVCQDQRLSLKGHSPLVLSEFVGAAKVFGQNAVLVNPWHPRGLAEGLHKALKFDEPEKAARWNKLHALVTKHDARTWYDANMKGLQHAWEEHATRDPANVPRMQIKRLRQKYDDANKRLLVIDFEGTLTTWDSPKESVVTVPLRVTELLSSLVDDPKNIVYVMSQHTMDSLEHMFRMLPKLGLIAENGAFLRKAGQREWKQMVEFDTKEWHAGVMNILKHYQTAIPRSTVRVLKSGIMFHYYDAEDQHDAVSKAGELSNQINEMCENLKVNATPFEKGLYIHPSIINKRQPMEAIESDLLKKSGAKNPDFVLVIGDSWEDECVFKWAHSLKGRVDDKNVLTCVVGKRSTVARSALTQGTEAVVQALEKLVLSSATKA
ncbi:Trehalose-6-P synthase/phosphatase complex subunit [Knufia obscura]|uniref:Trehalose-6-P synthase/phosphatase complex subunit n=2 Tax=Knufia TaxID=430999 RepID=A0AAN8I4G6_9EURO|nr:Trehalose-6-P synthase/phosphatase complex subunit [Knufia obscura]KAK5951679.1 Trehalose-6-P synthase/phosphatase complex subunit [Knufia fluminis]